jgi:site-specific recombinase XerD
VHFFEGREILGRSLADACARFLQHARYERGLSENTLAAYGQDLAELQAYAGPPAAAARLDEALVAEYLRHLRDRRRLKPASVRRRIAGMRALCKWLEREGVLEVSPFRTLDLKLPVPKRLPRALPREQVVSLLRSAGRLDTGAGAPAATRLLALARTAVAGADASPADRAPGAHSNSSPGGPSRTSSGSPPGGDGRDARRRGGAAGGSATTALALRLMMATGVRVGELTAIRLQDVTPDGRAIRIRGKGSRERTVFVANRALAGDLAAVLARRWREAAEAAVEEARAVGARGGGARAGGARAEGARAEGAGPGETGRPSRGARRGATGGATGGAKDRCAGTPAAASGAANEGGPERARRAARDRATPAEAPLLLNRQGRRLTPQALRLRLRRLSQAAGIAPHVTPHRFRHTAATCLIEEGVDIRFVQRLLGHSSIATTQLYTHVTDRSLIAALEAADPLGKLEG